MKIAFSIFLAALILPLSAQAITKCSGSITKNSFAEEKGGAGESQANNQQSAELKELEANYSPDTPVTAYGAACKDKRWLEEAKSKLAKLPEHRGKPWHVWLDKTSGRLVAAMGKPPDELMAE